MVSIVSFSPSIPEGKTLEVINLNKLPIPQGFGKKKIHYSQLKPGSWAGNHKHSRVEVFVSYDDLTFIWLDKLEKRHEESMGQTKDGNVKVFVVEPFTPHLIINNLNKSSTFIELAGGSLDDVINLNLIS